MVTGVRILTLIFKPLTFMKFLNFKIAQRGYSNKGASSNINVRVIIHICIYYSKEWFYDGNKSIKKYFL